MIDKSPHDAEPSSTPSMEENISTFQQCLDRVAKNNNAVIDAENHDWQTATVCVNALCRLLDNILLERQYQSKTRKIKLENKLFNERVGKVDGGVQYLLACGFIYTEGRPLSERSAVSKGKDICHAIKLPKEREDRTLLAAGRQYLNEYGSRILLMETGDQNNDLPPFNVPESVAEETSQIIRENVDSILQDSQDTRSFVASSLGSFDSEASDSYFSHGERSLGLSYSTIFSAQTFSCKSVDICQVICSEKSPPYLPLRMECQSDGFEVVRTKKNTGIEESLRKLQDAREALKNEVKMEQHSSLSYASYVRAHTAERIARKFMRGHKVDSIHQAFPHLDKAGLKLEEITEDLSHSYDCDDEAMPESRKGVATRKKEQTTGQSQSSSWLHSLARFAIYGPNISTNYLPSEDNQNPMAPNMKNLSSDNSLMSSSESRSVESDLSHASDPRIEKGNFYIKSDLNNSLHYLDDEYTLLKSVKRNFIPDPLPRALLRKRAERIVLETKIEQRIGSHEQQEVVQEIQTDGIIRIEENEKLSMVGNDAQKQENIGIHEDGDAYVTPVKYGMPSQVDHVVVESTPLDESDRWLQLKRNKVKILKVESGDMHQLEIPDTCQGEDVERECPADFPQQNESSSHLQIDSKKSSFAHSAIRLPLRSAGMQQSDTADTSRNTIRTQDTDEGLFSQTSDGACQARSIKQAGSVVSEANSSILTTSVHCGPMGNVVITFSSSSESEHSSSMELIDSQASLDSQHASI